MTRVPEEVKARLLEQFKQRFGEFNLKFYPTPNSTRNPMPNPDSKTGRPLVFASAPGRVELAGNHTDHQGGRTISAAITKRIYALAAPNGTDEIHAAMEGFGDAVVHLADLEVHPTEYGTSCALIRGMAAAYVQAGGTLGGFDMVVSSDIPAGRGLSSSAAFEMLVGVTIRALGDPAAPPPNPITLALEGKCAEGIYFGKPSGAQDQLASASGGISGLDFAPELPCVTPIAFDMAACDYTLLLIDSQCDHSRYTDEFLAIPADMYAVAHHFGRSSLEEVSYDEFLSQLASLRVSLGDRATLRALHYFEETQRVLAQQRALQLGDFEEFLRHVRLSGVSSAQFLQNVSPHDNSAGANQPAMVILALCAHLLRDRGAYRIHGGGFGGSILAFVAREETEAHIASLNKFLGYDACMRVSISPQGAYAERIDR